MNASLADQAAGQNEKIFHRSGIAIALEHHFCPIQSKEHAGEAQ